MVLFQRCRQSIALLGSLCRNHKIRFLLGFLQRKHLKSEKNKQSTLVAIDNFSFLYPFKQKRLELKPKAEGVSKLLPYRCFYSTQICLYQALLPKRRFKGRSVY